MEKWGMARSTLWPGSDFDRCIRIITNRGFGNHDRSSREPNFVTRISEVQGKERIKNMNTSQDILYYKEATPKDLNTLLMSHPLLKERWKLIPRIVRMLNQILIFNEKDGGKSDITYKFFKDLYKEDYTRIIQALEVLDLLKVTRISIPKSRNFKGKCYTYEVTETCQTLLANTNKEYLYKLFYDKKTIRKSQKLISKKKYYQKVYGDVVSGGMILP